MGTTRPGSDGDHRLKIRQVIVVEGKYDRARVLEAVSATVVEVGGFQIFKDAHMMEYLRHAARERGVIILTDSDAAGFQIRGYLKGALQGAAVSHAYIPATAGKERRKAAPSTEGLLGVEGMPAAVIREALQKAGATQGEPIGDLTKADLYEAGLLGKDGAADRRRALAARLSLPPRLSSTALLNVINLAMTRAEFLALADIGFVQSPKPMV
ncbi:MAG TPA: DUF4093 domain-containing protein [Candidatus Acidoferrum sp.]|nr:DUF4093 domain-containing protein [Candidatus Acidoferrum sp.]